jgi:hypothetical protein
LARLCICEDHAALQRWVSCKIGRAYWLLVHQEDDLASCFFQCWPRIVQHSFFKRCFDFLAHHQELSTGDDLRNDLQCHWSDLSLEVLGADCVPVSIS